VQLLLTLLDAGTELKKHIKAMLMALGGMVNDGHDMEQLKAQLEEKLKTKKALIVVDNIWTGDQLDALVPSAVAVGSIIIATSRMADFKAESSCWVKVCFCSRGVSGRHYGLASLRMAALAYGAPGQQYSILPE
jgi:hypothetical protein